MHLEETKYFCCCCCRSGPLSYVAYLPAKGYIPGQDMPVTVEIENGSNVKVREVICELLKVSVSFLLFTYFFIHSFIHSFIIFLFIRSSYMGPQPEGCRTCQNSCNINKANICTLHKKKTIKKFT